jgi:hypothetical protein
MAYKVAIVAELEFAYLAVMPQVQFLEQPFYVYFCSERAVGDYVTYDKVL